MPEKVYIDKFEELDSFEAIDSNLSDAFQDVALTEGQRMKVFNAYIDAKHKLGGSCCGGHCHGV